MRLKPDQLRSLWACIDQIPESRDRRGLRYPMRTAMAILVGARLAGCRTLTELSDFGRSLSQATLASIGSRLRPQSGRHEAPGISSWHYILKRIDTGEVERLLAAWTSEQVGCQAASEDDEHPPLHAVAIDGKVLRGSCDRDLGPDGVPLDEPAQQQLPALHLDSGSVIGQLGFSGKKDEAEGAALRDLVRSWAGTGTCVIADALHTQRTTAQHLLDRGLDCLLTVKANQPGVLEEVRDTSFHWDCRRPHVETSCDHGRIERRSIRVSGELDPELRCIGFPGVRFVAQVRREVECKKDGRQRKPVTACLLTSLPAEQATPQRLLRLNRACWGIENRVHWVRDVALGEDRSRIRKGSLPRLMAALANFAISILRLFRTKNITRRMNQLKMRPDQAVQLLLGAATSPL